MRLLLLLGLALLTAASSAGQSYKPGDIVITEVMVNPTPGVDATSEWFEIYNATDQAIDLEGWFVQDSAASGLRPYHKILSSLVIQPYGFLVLGNSTNTTDNGGVVVDYAYGGAMALSNALDKIRLVGPTTDGNNWQNPTRDGNGTITDPGNPAPDSLVIDRVRFSNATVSAQSGVSRELRNVTFDNHDMDDQNVWMDAPADQVYGFGGRGTPGAVGSTNLPVELVSFTATLDDRDALLSWATASETDNAGFQVEHHAPGASAFRRVAFLPGRGTTSEAHRYDYRLAALAAGTHVFRLRQVDLDGTATLSGTVEVVIASDGRVRVYPSPARSTVRIEGLAEAVDVVDALGRVVARAMPGEALSVDAWAPGVYVVLAAEPQRFVVAR